MTSRGVVGDDTNWQSEVASFGPPTRVERSDRWVRTMLGGQTLADSKQPWLHVAYGKPVRPGSQKPELPGYFFPIDDVDTTALEQSQVVDSRRWWHVVAGGRRYENAAWEYVEPTGVLQPLAGAITFDWDQMDSWFEEAEEVFEHARDPQHRVDVIASTRHIEVYFNNQLLAESSRPHLVFETSLPVRYYLPANDVNFDLLTPSELVTRCPYKGTAKFWSVATDSEAGDSIAWSYPDPIAENPRLKNLVAFYNERLDISVDNEVIDRPVTPWS